MVSVPHCGRPLVTNGANGANRANDGESADRGNSVKPRGNQKVGSTHLRCRCRSGRRHQLLLSHELSAEQRPLALQWGTLTCMNVQ